MMNRNLRAFDTMKTEVKNSVAREINNWDREYQEN